MMSQPTLQLVFTAVALLGIALVGFAQERDRDKIPDKYKWNLADIYPTEAAWRAAKDKFTAEIPSIATFKANEEASAQALASRDAELEGLQKKLSETTGLKEHLEGKLKSTVDGLRRA